MANYYYFIPTLPGIRPDSGSFMSVDEFLGLCRTHISARDYRTLVTVVKGDGKYMSIAAASILAKTYRDDYMLGLHEEYPLYHWDANKGYPSRAHREAIRQHGATPYHRMTFNLLGEGV